jgi:alpha-aminoadipic semialdehyde synthase
MDLECTLIDYEKVTDEKGKRLIFFGRHAGAAGAIETLYALGRALKRDGYANPFERIRRAYEYPDLAMAKEAICQVGEVIRTVGAPEGLGPLIIGVAGYGNVGQGTWEVLNLLPIELMEPEELAKLFESGSYDRKVVYGVTFKEQHMVAPISASRSDSGKPLRLPALLRKARGVPIHLRPLLAAPDGPDQRGLLG